MLPLLQQAKLVTGANDKEHAMSQNLNSDNAVIGIDIGKNSFHVVGLDERDRASEVVACPGGSTIFQLTALRANSLNY